jgi:MFS family permease
VAALPRSDGGLHRIPRPLRILLGANFVSEVGSGLTLPFLLIYLHEVRHLSLGVSGLLIGAASIVAMPAGPATGTLVDRFGPRIVMVGALVLAGAGALLLILARSPVSAIPALLCFGAGNGSTWPAWSALFGVMVHDEDLRPRVFARSFQLLNLGLGVGAVIAGIFVRAAEPSSFVLIYLVDGVTYGSVILALLLLPSRVFARRQDPQESQPGHPRGGYREVLADRRFRRYLLAIGALALAGYSAVNAGYVGYATTVVHVRPSVIAWAFGVNTGLIVLIQPLGLRAVHRMRRTTALALCACLFAAAWVVLGVSGAFPRKGAGDALVIAMFAVFAVGEVLLSPVAGPLVSAMARPGLLGRYNAASASVFSVTSVIGPTLAGAMLEARLGDEYLAVLVGCCAACVMALAPLRRTLSPELDNAPSARRRAGPTDVEQATVLASEAEERFG